ncbi:MAG: NYN domain-containing protein [Patescibacteria group bacterium]|nr:NYN domain-containing protein [Patescibacteria group bacterium]
MENKKNKKKNKKIRKGTKAKEVTAIYFDGSNFYHKLKDLKIFNTANFDYSGFAKWLARKRKIISNRYYVGVIRADKNDKKGQSLRANQQKLFARLKRKEFCIKGGYLMQNEGKYHEKGTDVKIAVDLLAGAYEDYYDSAILISSDTDLIPAIKKIRQLGKRVEYIGFAHKPSFGMQAHVTLSRLLIKDELMRFSAKGFSGRKKKKK